MKKTVILSVSLFTGLMGFFSCGGSTKTSTIDKPASDKLIGSWVAPVNGMPDMEEGMKLTEGGVASSINMATLVYEGWDTYGSNEYENADYLVLTGKSIGNGQTIDFTDTLKVDKLTADSLIVTQGSYTRAYHKASSVE